MPGVLDSVEKAILEEVIGNGHSMDVKKDDLAPPQLSGEPVAHVTSQVKAPTVI